MRVLSAKLTVLRSIAVIVALLVPPWAWVVIEMAAARSSSAIATPLQRKPLAGYAGACVTVAAPVVGLFVGWLLLRRRGGVHRTLAAVLGACSITVLLVCLGLHLIALGFPIET